MMALIKSINERAVSLGYVGDVRYSKLNGYIDIRDCPIERNPIKGYQVTLYTLYHGKSTDFKKKSDFHRHQGRERLFIDLQGVIDHLELNKRRRLWRRDFHLALHDNISNKISRFMYYMGVLTPDAVNDGFYDNFICNDEQLPIVMGHVEAVGRFRFSPIIYPLHNETHTTPLHIANKINESITKLSMLHWKTKPSKVAEEIGILIRTHFQTPPKMIIRIYDAAVGMSVIDVDVPLDMQYGLACFSEDKEPLNLAPRTSESEEPTEITIATAYEYANSDDE